MSEEPRRRNPEERNAERHQKAVEKRVRKVRHLDPFTLTCHADGRFTAQLDKPPSEIEPATARAILEKMDVVLEPLRRVAGPPGKDDARGG